jgi:hypothetical protein
LKKAVSGKKRRWLFVRLLLVAATAGGLFVFLVQKKERMLKECTRFFETSLSKQTDLHVTVDRIGGDILGLVRIQGVRVEEWLPTGNRTLFSAREIRVHYRFLDFLAKTPQGGVDILIDHPEVYWAPRVRLRRPDFPFLAWMRESFALGRKGVVVRAKDMDFFYGEGKKKISGVQARFERDKLSLVVPLSHISFDNLDFSSTIEIQGRLVRGLDSSRDEIHGTVSTGGTVVNWKPVLRESSMDFVFSREGLDITSSDVIGIEVLGRVDFTHDYELDISAKATHYPLSAVSDLLAFSRSFSMPGVADAEVHLQGSPWAPNMEGWFRIHEGWVGSRTFRALDLHVQGVYPTVRLTDSRILMEDGTTMRFADTALEIGDLLKNKTLERLIADAQQDTVVWGDWELSRAESRDERSSDFLMQRSLGDRARVHFRKYNEEEVYPNRRDSTGNEPRQMEVGFEYRLQSKDSVKLELRDGDELVVVERKMKF